MLIYVRNKAFPLKTFLCSAVPGDKVARIRAQLLHILYELGKEDHQFRLRYNGQVLRDAFTLDDYQIKDNAVVTMVPMGKSKDILMEIHSVTSSTSDLRSQGQPVSVKGALEKEVKIFDRRERLIGDFKALLYVHCLAVILSLLTTRWYAVCWLAVASFLGIWFVPTYSRLGGYVGNTSHIRQLFCIFAGIVSIICLVVGLYFAIFEWISISKNGCHDWNFEGTCSHRNVWTAVFFSLHSVIVIITSVLSWILLANVRVEQGDLIEKCLVQERDIEQVMAAARNGRVKEKRAAAFDLSAMAASSDDNKFRIVAEGGLEVLSRLAMSRDEVTQEHAVEALAEILTIPTVQDTFVDSGGIRTVTAMLHSPSPRAMQEAANALYNIVAESEHNKAAIVAEHGLEDLSHAAREGTIRCQRTVASIFLELAFTTEIRTQMASSNASTRALVYLCHSNDPDTLRFTLQTLELLAIESPELIYKQTDLLGLLLDLPFCTMDDNLYLLASKILLYFAENPKTCEQMLKEPRAHESLMAMVRTYSAMLQKVVVKIVHCMLETPRLRAQARELKMDSVLEYVRLHAADRDAWDMADECLQMMNSADDLSDLPALSTMEKLDKMKVKDDSFGSRTSLGSDSKGGSGSSGSSSDIKKGLA